IVNRVTNSGNTVRNSIDRNSDRLGNTIYLSGNSTRNAVDFHGINNLLTTNNIGRDLLFSIERSGYAERAQAERIASENRTLLNNIHRDILVSTKDTLLEICKSNDRLERQASENKATILLDAHQNREALAT